uniref:Connector enhancer of kinase suppressor of ras 3 n=1 Tax=Panagrellus redivivus TaxID=6233 RepID=A0A7E4ZXS4_PANRE
MSQQLFYSHGSYQTTSELFDIATVPTFQCYDWSAQQVFTWLRGIDDCVLPYVRLFRKAGLTGRDILLLDDSELLHIGVTSAFVREKILHAVQLLAYYCYNVHDENLQKLAMLISVDINTLNGAIARASPIIDKYYDGSDQLAGAKLTEILNSVLMSFSLMYEHVKKLVFWLDRAPFENQKEYIQIRDKVTEHIMEMLDSVNPQNRQYFAVAKVLLERGANLQNICQQIVSSTDPTVLYNTHFVYAFIRNIEYKPSCGINFQSVFNGIILVTSIEPESPAARCKKISAGDEILEINGEPVVGWTYEKVKALLNDAHRATDMKLLINRRPREEPTTNGMSKSKTSEILIDEDANNTSRLELDFSLKIQPDMFASREGSRKTLHRRRSSSFTLTNGGNGKNSDRLSMPVLNPSAIIGSKLVGTGDKRVLYRRASVWSDSPPASFVAMSRKIQNGLESKALMHLLDHWKEPQTRPNGNLRLVRQSRVAKAVNRLTDGNHNVPEEDEDVGDSQRLDKVEFTNVDLILPTEAERLKLSQPSLSDSEWSAPVQEITGLRFTKRFHLESTSSAAPDSPLSAAFTKITRFWNSEIGSNSNMIASLNSERGDVSVPSTPGTVHHALEKIAKEKSRQMTPTISVTSDTGSHQIKSVGTPEASPGMPSPSPRYSTVKTRTQLAPLAEPESSNSDEDLPQIGPYENFILPSLPEDSNEDAVDLEHFKNIASHLQKRKTLEGWLRRQQVVNHPNDLRKQRKTSQWIRSWVVVIDGRVLLSYSNQLAKHADIAFDLKKCHFHNSAVDIKTTKKYVFCLTSGGTWHHFAPYSQDDYYSWTTKLIPLLPAIDCNIAPPPTTTSLTTTISDATPPTSPPACYTLPRANLFQPTKKLFGRGSRQSSLSCHFRPESAEVSPRRSASGNIDE